MASAFTEGPDIVVKLACDFDSSVDFLVTAVAVFGWKFTDNTVTLDYVTSD